MKYQEGTTGTLSAFQFFKPLIQSKVSYELNIMFSFPGKTDHFMKVTYFLRTDLWMTRKESLSFRHYEK